LQTRTFYLIKEVEHFVKSQLNQRLREIGLQGSHYAVLSMVNRPEPLSSAQIARRFFVTSQSSYEVVSSLEKKQLIERHEDPKNRRILRISLTDAGRELLAACDRIGDELEEEIFSMLSPSEFEGLKLALWKILQYKRDHYSIGKNNT
jgi:DNA-binding MarR family transcriptional regulator